MIDANIGSDIKLVNAINLKYNCLQFLHVIYFFLSPNCFTRTQVSWIRSRDSHIVSVDGLTFIADERFHVFHDPATGSWTLQIKFVQARDAGTYECQVSSEPTMSTFVHLTVVSESMEGGKAVIQFKQFV